MRAHVTKRLVDGLKPSDKDFYVFDTALVGFGVRVRATGAMSFIVQYKAGSGRGAPTRRLDPRLSGQDGRPSRPEWLPGGYSGPSRMDMTRRRRAATVNEVIEAFFVNDGDKLCQMAA